MDTKDDQSGSVKESNSLFPRIIIIFVVILIIGILFGGCAGVINVLKYLGRMFD